MERDTETFEGHVNIPDEILRLAAGKDDIRVPQWRLVKCPLQYTWTLWYVNYLSKTYQQVIEGFRTPEEFLSIYRRIKRITDLPADRAYFLLKKGISPKSLDWGGGRWILTFKNSLKKELYELWIKTVPYLTEEPFGEFSDQVLGAEISVGDNEHHIGFWTAGASDEFSILGVVQRLKRLLKYKGDTITFVPSTKRHLKMPLKIKYDIDNIPEECSITETLKDTWFLWYFERKSTNWKENYESVTSFHTLEDFYSFMNYSRRPHELCIGSGFSLLKSGVSPVCDTELLENGNCLLISLNKSHTNLVLDRMWQLILQSVINGELKTYPNEINGVMTAIDSVKDNIYLWISNNAHTQHITEMRNILREQLKPVWNGELKYMGQNMLELEDKQDFAKRESVIVSSHIHRIQHILKELFYDVPEYLLMRGHLKSVWTFWFLDNNINHYLWKNEKKVTDCYTTSEFWSLFIGISHPSNLNQGSAYALCRKGSHPVWKNEGNGQWLFRFKSNHQGKEANQYWQKMLICLVGDVFDEQISGAIIQASALDHKLCVLTPDPRNVNSATNIGNQLKKSLQLSENVHLEYQINSIADEFEKPTDQQEMADMLLVRYKIAKKQDSVLDIPSGTGIESHLSQKWTLWYFDFNFRLKYDECWKEIITFNVLEDLLRLYNKMKRPSELNKRYGFSVFKENIRPLWSDAANQNGGQWVMKLESLKKKKKKKNDVDRIWWMAVVHIVGEVLVDCNNQLCGVVVANKNNQWKLSVWVTDASDQESVMEIGKALRTKLNIDKSVKLGFFSYKEMCDFSEAYKYAA